MPLQCLRARRHDITNLLQHAEELRLSRDARKRLAWFAYALSHDGNISLTCRYFGISRSTFLRWASRFDPRHPETLEDRSRRPHRVREPDTPPKLIVLIRQYRTVAPTAGKNIIARKLLEEFGLAVSASTVGRVIARERLFFADLPSHHHKRSGPDFSTATTACPLSSVPLSSSGDEAEAGEASDVAFPVTGS